MPYKFQIKTDSYLNVPCIRGEKVPVWIMQLVHRICSNQWMDSKAYKLRTAACCFIESYCEPKGRHHEPYTGEDEGEGFILVSVPCPVNGPILVDYINEEIKGATRCRELALLGPPVEKTI
ncbi:MAG: hypothetical protein JSU72_15240 [Deltaproteobacteria bacterium]|nr:MAG: hypothetical protein JSU72_15240 [Deltaproteobacteria bacterium]